MRSNTDKKSAILLLPIFVMIALLFYATPVYSDAATSIVGDSESVSIHLEGQKIIEEDNGKENEVISIPVPGGGWTSDEIVHEDDFSFAVIPAAENPEGVSGVPSAVSTQEGGLLDFGVWTFTQTGTWRFTVSEDYVKGWKTPEDIVVTITVVKDSANHLIAEVSYSKDTGLLFINERGDNPPPEPSNPGFLPLEGEKILQSSGERLPVEQGQFAFILTADRTSDPEGYELPKQTRTTNNSDGTFAFDPIKFTKTGRYIFYISEEPGTAKGYTYDSSLYTVTVTAGVDDANVIDPVISSIVTGSQETEKIVFVNEYEEEGLRASVNITGTKTLSGSKKTEDIKGGEFTFLVKEAAENDRSAYAGVTEKVLVQKGGAIDFGTWYFTKEGTYKFTITEEQGSLPGYTYDKSVIEVTVTVLYSEAENRLYASLKFIKDGKEVTQGKPVTFENQYTTKTPTPTPTVTPTKTPTPTVTPSRTPTPYSTRPPSANTGDPNNMTLWLVLMIAAAVCAGIIITVHFTRRNRK